MLVLAGALPAATAAPLQPHETRVEVTINGTINCSTAPMPMPPVAPVSFTGNVSATRFIENGTRLEQDVALAPIPGFDHEGMVGATAGATFEQVAVNEYLLKLNSGSRGSLRRGTTPVFNSGDYGAASHVLVNSQFRVLPLPGQREGMPSTVFVRVEHTGTLTGTNGGSGSSMANVQVSGGVGSPFSYSDRLDLTSGMPSYFDGWTITGTRDRVAEGALLTSVGQTITLSAILDTSVKTSLPGTYPVSYRASEVSFDPGLVLRLTVMPEPVTVVSMLIATLLAGRRRR